MRESPFYESVIQRGIEQGIEQGMERGIERGIEQGIERGIEQGMERGIEQGIEQGTRQTTIENTLSVLTARFPDADVPAVKPALEAIRDINRLKQVSLTAALVSSFREFRRGLDT